MAELNESEEKRSASRKKGVVLSYLYSAAQIIVNLLYVPLLIRGLGSDEYGLFQLIGSIMAYIAIMNTMFSGGVTRFYCKFFFSGDEKGMENCLAVCRGIYRVVSVLAYVVGAVVAVVVYFVYADVLTDFQQIETSIMLFILITNLVVTMHNTINIAVINAHERFVFLQAISLFGVLIQPIIVVVAIQFYPYAFVICCVQLLTNCFCAAAQRYCARNVLGGKVKRHYQDKTLLKEILVYSSAILLALIADQIFWKTNQLILGAYLGMGTVAIYAVAMQIAYTAYMPLGTAVSAVFVPKISELYFKHHDTKAVSNLFSSVGRIAAYPLTLVLFGFIVFGQDFILMWAGPGYEDAYWIALVVMIPFTVDLVQNIGIAILQVFNKYAFRGKVYLVMALVNIVLVVLVMPYFGAIGMAAVSGLCMLVGNGLVMNAYYQKVIGLDVLNFWKNFGRVVLPLLVVLAAALTIRAAFGYAITSWIVLIAAIVVFTIAFGVVAWLFSANDYERSLVWGVLGKLKR